MYLLWAWFVSGPVKRKINVFLDEKDGVGEVGGKINVTNQQFPCSIRIKLSHRSW